MTMFVIYFVYPSYGEQRARLVQSSPAKAGYATAGRMTYVFRHSEELQIFVENSLSSASIAVTLNEESGTLWYTLSILPMESSVQGSSGWRCFPSLWGVFLLLLLTKNLELCEILCLSFLWRTTCETRQDDDVAGEQRARLVRMTYVFRHSEESSCCYS